MTVKKRSGEMEKFDADKINKVLEKFDISIDFISRVKSKKINNDYKSKWIIPDFYLPMIN